MAAMVLRVAEKSGGLVAKMTRGCQSTLGSCNMLSQKNRTAKSGHTLASRWYQRGADPFHDPAVDVRKHDGR